jgi:hypothetical protein
MTTKELIKVEKEVFYFTKHIMIKNGELLIVYHSR